MAVRYTIPYKDFGDQQWRIDIGDNISSFADPVFNITLDQSAYPLVKCSVLLQDTTTGENRYIRTNQSTGSITVMQGHQYLLQASAPGVKKRRGDPQAQVRLTILENGVLIFDQQVDIGNDVIINKTGKAIPGYIYDVTVSGVNDQEPVTPVDIESDPAGAPIPVRGNGSAGVIAWTADATDDPFACYKSSKLTINLLQEGQINIAELQVAQDRDYIVKVYREGLLYWQGFLVADGISYPLQSSPNNITLEAICGLTMLDSLPYAHTDLPGTTVQTSFCPMNYIRDILFLNLGNTLPIRWTNLLTCTAFGYDDVLTGGVQWSVRGEGYLSYQSGSGGDQPGPVQNCDYILKGLLQSMQCCIYLADGRWNIRRINDLVRISVPYKQIAGDTGIMNIQTGTQNLVSQIGRYGLPFLNKNAIMTNKPGIRSSQVTYTSNVRDNILPNGNMDLSELNGVFFGPLYWNVYDPARPFDRNAVSSIGSLDGRRGFAADLNFEGTSLDPDEYFTMFGERFLDFELGKNGLPIDTQTMITYINFGFLMEIISGFPLASGGVIDWTSEPLRIKVIFNVGGIQYFLNKYGFWVVTDTYIPITVDNLRPQDIAKVDFNAFQNIIMPAPPAQPVAGYESNIQVLFQIAHGQEYKVDNVYINIDKGNDVYLSEYPATRNTTTDKRELNISSSYGGYQLSNLMSTPFKSGDECFFRDGAVYQGTLTGMTANAVMRCMYKAMRILNTDINTRGQNWSFDSTYFVDSLATSFFLPLNASYDTEKCTVSGLVAIEIRNDNVTFTETYFSSNDNQLSN